MSHLGRHHLVVCRPAGLIPHLPAETRLWVIGVAASSYVIPAAGLLALGSWAQGM